MQEKQTELSGRLRKLTKPSATDSLGDVLEHLDEILWVGTALWFRFNYQYKRQNSRDRGSLLATNQQRVPWWRDPTLFYISMAVWHPRSQTFLWLRLESSLAGHFDIPASTILSYLDLAYFAGTALWFRLFWSGVIFGRRHDSNRGRGGANGNSRSGTSSGSAESDLYQRRRDMNFKDPALHDFMQTCQDLKQKLRSVPDPQLSRQEKIQRIRRESRAKEAGPLQLSEDRLQQERARLHKTEKGQELLQ